MTEMMLEKIMLKDFRCFHEKQQVSMAPLTLLVGENSTGKTSFMAMVRILDDLLVHSSDYEFNFPDFKKDPYDLGSFDEIAHHHGANIGQSDTFEAGYSTVVPRRHGENTKQETYTFEITFGKEGTSPVPLRWHTSLGDIWIEVVVGENGENRSISRIGTSRGTWDLPIDDRMISRLGSIREMPTPNLMRYILRSIFGPRRSEDDLPRSTDGSVEFTEDDANEFHRLSRIIPRPYRRRSSRNVFASAPVRSKPQRTYDPARPVPDPEGDYIPMYLADVYSRDKDTWSSLKKELEAFGKSAGIFDEISIRQFGNANDPFQVQIRRIGHQVEEPLHNLIDMGYGVSQVLPMITELLRENAPMLALLQQPEVHLHPSAQAALGTLFCQVATRGPQLIVETHSDYLLDRVRMEVRDGEVDIGPDDVAILYFERNDLDVKIHRVWLDAQGNVDPPPGYRNFFAKETRRLLDL